MQCPETPRAEIQNCLPTSRTISRDAATARRRSTLRRPLGDLPNFDCDFSFEGGTPRKPKTLLDVSSPCWKKPIDGPPASIASCVSKGTSLENVFVEAELESRPRSSVAALQFHNAAEKLRFATLPSVLGSESTIDDDSARLWMQASTAFSTEQVSRRYSTPRRSQICISPPERDITSARRSVLYTLGENHAGPNTPTEEPEKNVFESPTSKVRAQGPGTESTVRNIAQHRSFSRPVCRPRLYTIRDSKIRPGSHGVPTTPAVIRALVYTKDHMESCSPGVRALSVESVSNSCEQAKEQHEIMTTARPIDPSNQPEVYGTFDSRGEPPAVLELTQESGRLVSECRSDDSPQPRSIDLPDHVRKSFDSAVTESLGDGRAHLKRWEIWCIRLFFSLFIFAVNIAFGLAYLGSHKHPYLLAILVFMKSKDILSTLTDILGLLRNFAHNKIWPRKEARPKWILSLVCAYAETEEQIMKTVLSLVKGRTWPHKQAICIILDGKPRDVLSKISVVKATLTLPYTTWKRERGELNIHAGLIEGTAVILMEKVKNAGKKDSLILGHDLFNYPREDMPHSTKLLRQELWKTIIPSIITNEALTAFDYIFCTDADSTTHDQALCKLADALCRENNAIAGCGVLFAEFGKAKTEYSMWHLFQQFQYTFGQYVRRQAESMWGRVTCLPGCITMIAVRPEMGPALSEYAKPVTGHNIFLHQIQYLGTDRRLTWCIMSQNKHLRTIFVPDALSETVVPSSLSHYLSQRRRWASNAYFNDFWLVLGPQQRLITRLFALVDLVRLTLVFYRVFNTAYFLHGLITHFYVIKIVPTLIVTKMPAAWYLLLIMIKEPLLRKRLHKLVLGMCINQIISPILSVVVFVNVLLHVGSHAWGKTGASTQNPVPEPVAASMQEPKPAQPWTPKRLAKTIKTAIRGPTLKTQPKQHVCTPQVPHKSSKQKNSTVAACATRRSPGMERSVPSVNTTTGTNKATANTTSLDTVEKSHNSPSSLTFTPAPAGRIRQNSYSTPLSLIRRTPHH